MSPPRARGVTTRAALRDLLSGAGFQRFFAARAVSQLGDGLFQLAAATVLLFEDPGPNPVLGLLALSAVTLIPFSVIGPLSGVFIDRWDRRRIITLVPLLRALITLLVPLAAAIGDRIPFLLVVLLVLSANRFFLATMSAVLPQLVPADELLVANSVSSTGGSIANVTGQGAGSALAALLGGVTAGTLSAAPFALAAVVASRVPAHRGHAVERGPLRQQLATVLEEMREGLRSVWRAPRVAYALSAVCLVQLLVGVMVGVLVFEFIVTLDLAIGAATVILAVLGAGIGIGVVAVPMVARHLREDLLVPLAFLISLVGAVVGVSALSRPLMTLSAGILGIAYAFAKIPVDTIVQEEMPDEVRGRAFAVYDVVFNLSRVAGIAIAALAYELHAQGSTIVGAVAIAYGGGAVGFSIWERLIRRRRAGPRRPGDLLLAGEMVRVRSYSGYRADEEPRAIVVGGTEIPIEAVDWRAVVERDGRRSRVFVVRAGGVRLRLAQHEESVAWEIERVLPAPQVQQAGAGVKRWRRRPGTV